MPPIKVFPAFTPLIKRVVGDHIELLARVLNKVAARNSRTYFIQGELSLIDQTASEEQAVKYFSDGVHPSQLTYQIWAELASDFVTGRNILIKN